MSETFQAESAYCYPTITAITEKRLKGFLEQAEASPEKAEKLLSFFSATFQLWFDITREDPTSQREKDGPRFLDLIPMFPAFEKPRQSGAVQVSKVQADTQAALTAALESVVYRLDVRQSCGEATALDALALEQARAALSRVQVVPAPENV